MKTTPHTPKGKVALQVIVMPRDLNHLGTLFGGTMLAYFDQAGALCAMERCRSSVVLAGMNNSRFIMPAFVNDQLTIYAQILKVGSTSMVVGLEAFRSHAPTGTMELAATAEMVYVAIGPDLKPHPVDRPAARKAVARVKAPVRPAAKPRTKGAARR